MGTGKKGEWKLGEKGLGTGRQGMETGREGMRTRIKGDDNWEIRG